MRLTARPRGAQDPSPARAGRVFVHVGAPVTGSTYLRETLGRHRRRLTRFGVLYPSCHVGSGAGHLDAVLDVLGLADAGPRTTTGAWERLTQAARDWRRGTVVVSHELLADADVHQAQRVVSGFEGREVHVVYAARDLASQLPIAWQEWVRNGGTAGFASYVDKVAGHDPHRLSRVFWRSHDAEAVLRRWSEFVPPERVHLLTAPAGPGQDRVLWQRFATTVGVDPDLAPSGAAPGPMLLSAAALECLGRLNAATGRPPGAAVLAAATRVGGPSPAPGPEHERWLRAEGERVLDAVKDAGYDVVGDVTDLRPPPAAFASDPRQVAPSAEDLVAAQTRLLAAVLPAVARDADGPAGRSRRALQALPGVRPVRH